MPTSPTPSRHRFAAVVAFVFLMLSLPLAAGGIWLLTLGGSPYYLLAGLGLLLTGLMLRGGQTGALWVYALLLLSSLVWSVWEAGLDWWPLAARLDLLFVLGLLLLLPWVMRALGTPVRHASPARGGGLLLSIAMIASLAVAIASWIHDPHDIDGALPVSQGGLIAKGEAIRGVEPGEWHAYGRTGFGQRYSPLDQITAEQRRPPRDRLALPHR